MPYYLLELVCEVLYEIRVFEDHGDEELSERGNQPLHILVPVVSVLQNWGGEHLVVLLQLVRAGNQGCVDLEAVPHQVLDITLYYIVNSLGQLQFKLSSGCLVLFGVPKSESCRLKEYVEIVRAGRFLIFGGLSDETAEDFA